MIDMAYADTAANGAAGGVMSFLPMILIFVVMWFLMIRPQQKAEKNRREMVSQLKKGDRVMLSSGIYGRVVHAGEHLIKLDLGKNVVVEVNPNAIAAKVEDSSTQEATEKKSES